MLGDNRIHISPFRPELAQHSQPGYFSERPRMSSLKDGIGYEDIKDIK